ncbi:N-acetylmuramoyl-L-alanine amidase [Pseudalkalibacillus caeni]|nr:N-acetylmuramoyl-L-alanine amidase [Pseudalkalibacillus caeni]
MLVIDAGHGGIDPGAVVNGIWEKDWTLEVSLYQHERFKELGIPVLLTRDRDQALSPEARAAKVRQSGARFCISNHYNSGGGSGCETIHSIHSDGKLAKSIGRSLNVEGMPLRRVFSKKGTSGDDYYYMHRKTGKVETIIVEYGFLDSNRDRKKLKSFSDRMRFAEAVVQVMCTTLGFPYTSKAKGLATDLYYVQIGAFKNQQNASALLKELNKKGYQAIIKKG